MKIAWIRYPEKLYTSGKVLKGGSESANQYVIDWLRSHGHEVIDFMPNSQERIGLISSQAIGTPLMFQDLLKEIDAINNCDLVVTTNWFSAILPEIKKPICVVYHSSAQMVMDSIKQENIAEKAVLNKWLNIARKFDLAQFSNQSDHEIVISLGESYQAQHATKIIAVSRLLKDKIIEYYNINQSKIKVINNSFPEGWDQEIKKDFKESLKIINVSRLPHDFNGFVGKGTDRLMEVLNHFPKNKKILLATTKKNAYPNLLKENLRNFELIENASRDQVKNKLSEAHISIHTSRAEACQLTLIESMLLKTLPITFNLGVAEELIKNGENGFIVNSTKEMIAKLNWALKNPENANKMAERAHQTIIYKLSIDRIGCEYEKFFLGLIKEKNAQN